MIDLKRGYSTLALKRDNLINKIYKKEINLARKEIENKIKNTDKKKKKNLGKFKKIVIKDSHFIKNNKKKIKEKLKEKKKANKRKESKKGLEKKEEYKLQKKIIKKELEIDEKMSLSELEKLDKENREKLEKEKKRKPNLEFSKQELNISSFKKDLENLRKEISKIVIGQESVIEGILRALLADGHLIIEGVPGIAKTLLIRALAEASGCKFSRIQFTVDLLPTDITGITTYTPGKGFETIKGPIFANFIIADEVNRAPPKTQSALLEAMQEKQVTIGKSTYKLDEPFFVMANNNPIESSGTYRLPEAQMDRFLFKLKMNYPKNEDEEIIIDNNITLHKFEDFKIKKILSPKRIIELQNITKEIKASSQIKKYVVRIVEASRNPKKNNIKLGKYVEWGGSPRASIALYIGAKADAILKGQKSVTPQNIKNVAHDSLRHRILLNYSGQAENIDTDTIIDEILSKVKVP